MFSEILFYSFAFAILIWFFLFPENLGRHLAIIAKSYKEEVESEEEVGSDE